MTILSTTTVIPLTEANRRGIDDILGSVKTLYGIKVHEAYVVEATDPDAITIAEILARKSGVVVTPPPATIKLQRKTRKQQPATQAGGEA